MTNITKFGVSQGRWQLFDGLWKDVDGAFEI